MYCANCNEKISSSPVKQGDELYCSLECANAAAGYDSLEEESDYYEEDDIIIPEMDDYEE